MAIKRILLRTLVVILSVYPCISFNKAFADDFWDAIYAYNDEDYPKALSLFERSADSGNTRAQFWLGSIHQEGAIVRRDYAIAVKWYKLSARNGEADAQYNLALMYRLGQGVEESNAQAITWLKSAVEQGHANAQSDLGSMYAHGIGTNKNTQKAIDLFQKSAAQCNPIGQVNLGRLYVTGNGVRQNDVTAYMWFHVAASQGLGTEYIEGKVEATEDRDFLFDSLSSSQVQEAITLAEPHIKRCIQFRIDKL